MVCMSCLLLSKEHHDSGEVLSGRACCLKLRGWAARR
jgi:hypothetical protein